VYLFALKKLDKPTNDGEADGRTNRTSGSVHESCSRSWVGLARCICIVVIYCVKYVLIGFFILYITILAVVVVYGIQYNRYYQNIFIYMRSFILLYYIILLLWIMLFMILKPKFVEPKVGVVI